MNEKKLSIKNNISELDVINCTIAELAAEWQIPMKVAFNLNLVLEEIFTNIVFYGFDDKNEHEIIITFALDHAELHVCIEDEGKDFNPLVIDADEEVHKALDDRKIGGLGIHFLKKMMNGIKYWRADNKNYLTFSTTIK